MAKVDSSVSCGNVGQCLNPAFVHSIAVPEMDMLPGLDKTCAVARGDGVVDVIDLESKLATMKSKNLSRSKNFQSTSKKSDVQAANHAIGQNLGKRIQLDYSLGGHTAAVSCV